MVFQLVLNLAIQLIVGRLGILAVAGVGFANSLILVGMVSPSALWGRPAPSSPHVPTVRVIRWASREP